MPAGNMASSAAGCVWLCKCMRVSSVLQLPPRLSDSVRTKAGGGGQTVCNLSRGLSWSGGGCAGVYRGDLARIARWLVEMRLGWGRSRGPYLL